MLWYKFWLESRLRFSLSFAGLVLFAVSFPLYTKARFTSPPSVKNQHFFLFVTHQYLITFWMLSVIFLGMGGLLQEKATGISQFTLALPVDRMRITAVRFGVYLLEAIVLAVAPWIALVLAAHRTGQPWSVPEALFFDSLLIGGGFAYLGVVVLVSSLIEGTYTAPVVTFGVIIIVQILFNAVNWLRPLNFLRVAGGVNYIDRDTWLFVKPFPWIEVLLSMSFLVLMLAISIRAIQRREF